jgi:hypothetical protein
MNVKLLRQVAAAILNEPKAFDMEAWFDHSSQVAPCGTTACIGGWMGVILMKKKRPGDLIISGGWEWDVVNQKMEHLALHKTWGECGLDQDQRDRLFYDYNWPDEFMVAYNEAKALGDYEAAAMVAAARIEHFIATEGRE